ncbi:MAG: transglycosylase SLT domain-containing protein [Bacteroidales bacterium]|nr:transglycosylase SLT domain-containing protein [Bacteroidales bacterium]
MKKFYLIAVILLTIPVAAGAQSREALKSENRQLRQRLEAAEKEVDSLRDQIAEMKARLDAYQGIPQEVLDFYKAEADAKAQAQAQAQGAVTHPGDATATGTTGTVTYKTDSLLSVWYIHNQMRNSAEADGMGEMGDVHFTSSVPDSVLINRLNKMNAFIKLPYNETVRNKMVLYSEKMPYRMSQMLALSKFYMPIFEETFRKYNLPMELKYLCIIESAMNPIAVSRAGAAGMWQFMYSTARHYGLQVDSYIDERLDPFKEADAAARLLRDNYNIFGDWSLAISAYNCGPGNVNKAIYRAGGSKDFWTIYQYLPQETRGYVPGLVGAMYAFHYAKEYGLTPADIEMPAHVDTFHINKNLHLRQISEVLGIPLDEIRSWNHQYYRDIIPGNQGTQILRLPYIYSSQFTSRQKEIYAYKADEYLGGQGGINRQTGSSGGYAQTSGGGRGGSSYVSSGGRGGRSGGTTRQPQWVYHTVKSGENLGRIANKYHTTVSNLKKWNNLRGENPIIQPGQRLKVGKR